MVASVKDGLLLLAQHLQLFHVGTKTRTEYACRLDREAQAVHVIVGLKGIDHWQEAPTIADLFFDPSLALRSAQHLPNLTSRCIQQARQVRLSDGVRHQPIKTGLSQAQIQRIIHFLQMDLQSMRQIVHITFKVITTVAVIPHQTCVYQTSQRYLHRGARGPDELGQGPLRQMRARRYAFATNVIDDFTQRFALAGGEIEGHR
ncbi:hypothetical protein D3C76_958110 [compost metagenome]